MSERFDLSMTTMDCDVLASALGELSLAASIDRQRLTPQEQSCLDRLAIRIGCARRRLNDRLPAEAAMVRAAPASPHGD